MNEPQKVPSYRIEFEKIADYDELILQFNRVRRTAIYQHKEHFPETAVILCISKNQGYMCKKTTVKTANGGYRKSFVRDEHNPLYNSCIPHEVSPHIHFLAVGKGSRSLCEKVAKNENRKAKKCTAKIFSNKASISTVVGYITEQATSIRRIGNLEDYL